MTPDPAVADLSWDTVRDRLAVGASAILPIGAGSKQHGFHLPLGTDLLQAEWFAMKLAALTGGLVWPTLSYGYYPSFERYAGSVSVGAEAFFMFVRDILNGLLTQTAGNVFIVNTGISTIPVLRTAIRASLLPERVVQIDIYTGTTFCKVRDDVLGERSGGHADEIETSILLTIAPDCVDLSRAVPSPPGHGHDPGPLSPCNTNSPNYSPSGVIGDPTRAGAEHGRRLVAAILEDLAHAVGATGETRFDDRQKHNNHKRQNSNDT